MKVLYSSKTIQQEKKHVRTGRIAASILAVTGLAICISFCFGVRTANADSRRLIVIAVSTLTGWGIILLVRGWILPETREYQHEEGLLNGIWDCSANRFFPESPEIHEGEILSIGEAFQIPKSISFCSVSLREPTGEIHLRLNARNRQDFPSAGAVIRVKSIRKYITEYEVTHHV